MKEVTAYETDDGRVFPSADEARTHELAEAIEIVGSRPSDVIRNALNRQPGTEQVRTALADLGDEVRRQDSEGHGEVQGDPPVQANPQPDPTKQDQAALA